MTKQKLEPQYARLTKIEGFIEAFWEMLCDFKKQEDAYEAVERQYKFIFGERRYKSFNSFRKTRDIYLKKKRDEKKS